MNKKPRNYRNFRRSHRQSGSSGKMGHSTMNINQLINRVNDEALAKPVEYVLKHEFKDFKINDRLRDNIVKKGYTTPTPIQDGTIPAGLEGRDVIGIANTGTGKTAAFLIPLVNKILANRSERVLILAPTRELAFQINQEFSEFARGLGISSVLCIGGTPYFKQRNIFRNNVNVVIGTPGRIIDLLNRKFFSLSNFRNVVLDEADRMVDMGFINDIRLLLGQLPEKRQSFFFTATMEKKVEDLIREFLHDPVKVSVRTRNTPVNIEQNIIKVPNETIKKRDTLIEMLKKDEFEKVLIFCRTKRGTERVVKDLRWGGIESDSIHGNKTQSHRIKALNKFKQNIVKVLVATDVASRGLDINGVSHVINFDIPANYDDYVHRIGRTGRADQRGYALTFVPVF